MTHLPELTIRALAPSDKAQWSHLWTAYLAYYETERPQDIHDLYFERLLGDDPQDYTGLVAEQDGQLVGLVHFLSHRHGWSKENVIYLQDLYADPTVRGNGIGRALIEAVYDAGDAAGTPTVYWLTQDFNETARKLYDRIGVKTPFIKYSRP
ncbi:MAG: N-acetyltransferase family protein [Roseobacter sp.]